MTVSPGSRGHRPARIRATIERIGDVAVERHLRCGRYVGRARQLDERTTKPWTVVDPSWTLAVRLLEPSMAPSGSGCRPHACSKASASIRHRSSTASPTSAELRGASGLGASCHDS